MILNKLLLLLGVLSVFAAPVAAQKTVYDANVEVRNVSGSFNAVKISSAIDLYISQSTSDQVAVSATPESGKASIVTEVKNGTLYIYYKSSNNNWNGPKKMKAYVSAKTLNRIEASGACNVFVDGSLNSNDLVIDISGASDFKGAVNVQNLKLLGSGSSDFTISGTTANLKVDVSGASDIKAYELSCDYCDIEASGASDVKITANKELKARASGASDISYKGNAAVKEANTSGASDVKKKG